MNKENSNTHYVEEEIESFAKLEGNNFKFFIDKLSVILGRESIHFRANNDEQFIFVGNSYKISRRHALISWNKHRGFWEIKILSKNKTKVNGVSLKRGDRPAILHPGSLIQIDNSKFYFFPAVSIPPPL
jgi:pSer/pThr/pTyr-binding forkhead associated (FHA) protein